MWQRKVGPCPTFIDNMVLAWSTHQINWSKEFMSLSPYLPAFQFAPLSSWRGGVSRNPIRSGSDRAWLQSIFDIGFCHLNIFFAELAWLMSIEISCRTPWKSAQIHRRQLMPCLIVFAEIIAQMGVTNWCNNYVFNPWWCSFHRWWLVEQLLKRKESLLPSLDKIYLVKANFVSSASCSLPRGKVVNPPSNYTMRCSSCRWETDSWAK